MLGFDDRGVNYRPRFWDANSSGEAFPFENCTTKRVAWSNEKVHELSPQQEQLSSSRKSKSSRIRILIAGPYPVMAAMPIQGNMWKIRQTQLRCLPYSFLKRHLLTLLSRCRPYPTQQRAPNVYKPSPSVATQRRCESRSVSHAGQLSVLEEGGLFQSRGDGTSRVRLPQ
jgi:hypothetical protein